MSFGIPLRIKYPRDDTLCVCCFYKGITLLTAFSMKRNWYRLVAETKPDKETRDMRCLHAIKTISMFNITSGHSFWYMISTPFSNPIFVEKVKGF